MTDRNFGTGDNQWWGIIENVFDPEKEGRYQVRVHGWMDDTVNIPDKELAWAKNTMDATSAGHNKVGYLPVGLIKGTTVGGHWADFDKQYPVITHTIAKAGDAQQGTTTNSQTQLVEGTNSNPITERNKNNKIITRKGKNIKEEDSLPPQQYAPESKDSEGRDIAGEEVSKTKFSQIPTVASLINPIGSILQQITKVDPSYLNSVLPNAVQAFTKIKNLNSFSGTGNITDILGQTLSMAMGTVFSSIGAATLLNALGSSIDPAQLSPIAQQALGTALSSIVVELGSDTGIHIPRSIASFVGNSSDIQTVTNLQSQIVSLANQMTVGTVAFNSGRTKIDALREQIVSLGFDSYEYENFPSTSPTSQKTIVNAVLNAIGAGQGNGQPTFMWTNNWSNVNGITTNSITITYHVVSTGETAFSEVSIVDQPNSDLVFEILNSTSDALSQSLISLVNSGQLSTDTFNALMSAFFNQIQSQGTQATLGAGVTPSNILNVLQQVLPMIASQIEGTLQGHLPISVLNNGTVTDAIKKFAMNQAFLKAPTDGKKALAIEATQQGSTGLNGQIQSAISGVQGLTTNTLQTLGHLF